MAGPDANRRAPAADRRAGRGAIIAGRKGTTPQGRRILRAQRYKALIEPQVRFRVATRQSPQVPVCQTTRLLACTS